MLLVCPNLIKNSEDEEKAKNWIYWLADFSLKTPSSFSEQLLLTGKFIQSKKIIKKTFILSFFNVQSFIGRVL